LFLRCTIFIDQSPDKENKNNHDIVGALITLRQVIEVRSTLEENQFPLGAESSAPGPPCDELLYDSYSALAGSGVGGASSILGASLPPPQPMTEIENTVQRDITKRDFRFIGQRLLDKVELEYRPRQTDKL
jgi:hypothetical protein